MYVGIMALDWIDVQEWNIMKKDIKMQMKIKINYYYNHYNKYKY